MIPIDRINWDEYAQFDGCFSSWLKRVDTLCQNLLNCGLYDLIAAGDLDVHEAYYTQHWRPEAYVAEAIVPLLESEYGYELVHEALAESVLRGAPPEGP